MKIEKMINHTEVTLTLTGRLDTTTAPELDAAIKEYMEGTAKMVLDFANLAYISSAGLRVLLAAQKTMGNRGELIIQNVNETIMEIFDMTGFCDILTIQ